MVRRVVVLVWPGAPGQLGYTKVKVRVLVDLFKIQMSHLSVECDAALLGAKQGRPTPPTRLSAWHGMWVLATCG